MSTDINFVAVVAAAVASMVVGYLWYGPLFGKTWMKLTGMKEMGNKDEMPKAYLLTFVGALLSAYVLAVILGLTKTIDLAGSLTVAFWVWLGFLAPLLLGGVLWEGKSWNLYFLNASQKLVDLLVVAAVLSYLR